MRFIVLICTLLWAVQCPAQLQWSGPLHIDLGEVRRKETYRMHFTFSNAGDRPVILDNVRTDCGCTAPEWSREPLAPGDTSTIVLEFTPASRGRHRKKARVWIRGEQRPVTLSFEARVR